ncbi:LuxR C-terminal-related transcriptional regulator [Falsibacillus albus]|uniref:LuxR C-terminal-related transcriptional regulator n=1 Tax=Falsibacillus albus TaxID=2478915 RepID=UPI001314840C|nr:LuxR C-terminal-related transcriptional regulator [Falsibacillus albus]
MENKIKELFSRGMELLLTYEKEFHLEWRLVKKELINRKFELLQQFDQMIQIGYEVAGGNESISIDQFTLSMATEWNKRFPVLENDGDAIFIITIIENTFHDILAKHKANLLDHQAIQSIFSRMTDQVLMTNQLELQSEKWLNLMLSTKIFPIHWMSIVHHQQGEYCVHRVVCRESSGTQDQLIHICEGLKGKQLSDLTLALGRLLTDSKEEGKMVHIPCMNDHLLLFMPVEAAVTDQQRDWFRSMYLRQIKLNHLRSELEWKDAALLYLQRLLHTSSSREAVEAISQGLVDYMPFKRCGLFIYSPNDERGIGVFGYNLEPRSIEQIRENIHQFPLLKKYFSLLSNSKPIYISDASEVLPEKYIQSYQLKSLVVVPIYVPTYNKLIGVALLDQGERSEFLVSTQTMSTLIKFGQYAGELLYQYWEDALKEFSIGHALLTPREKDVLRHISMGESINETAEALDLSSYTVRDYVSSIIQKMDARNRTEAAVKAIKMKII